MPDCSLRRDPRPETGSTQGFGVQEAPCPRQAPSPPPQPQVLTRRRWGWVAAGAQPGTCCRRRVLGPVSAPLGRPQPSPWQGTGTPLLQEAGDRHGISAAAPDSNAHGASRSPQGIMSQSIPLCPQRCPGDGAAGERPPGGPQREGDGGGSGACHGQGERGWGALRVTCIELGAVDSSHHRVQLPACRQGGLVSWGGSPPCCTP